jgi:hypothetical protein
LVRAGRESAGSQPASGGCTIGFMVRMDSDDVHPAKLKSKV